MRKKSKRKVSTIAVLSLGGTLIFGSAAEAATILTDLTTGGTATAGPGSTPTNEVPANAFDNSEGTKLLVFTNPTPATPITVTYDFAGSTAHVVQMYSLTSANDAPERDPRDFRLLGSNDNFATAGTVIDSRSGIAFVDGPDADASNRFETQFFTVAGVFPAFQQYRLEIQESFDTNNDRPQIAEIQLFDAVPEPSAVAAVLMGSFCVLTRRRRTAARE